MGINGQKLYSKLCRLRDSWERDSESLDISIGREWAKGVVYGLCLAIAEIRAIMNYKEKP